MKSIAKNVLFVAAVFVGIRIGKQIVAPMLPQTVADMANKYLP